ncbi:succinylglutamate desuccinylase [Nostoc linckia z18]|uniref:Succinylglutamate desuccinylase n=2 Tax=Nostoc linckia TaxID=92942 RepID=A0A9Q5Z6B0_NOSLI|nr:succinylglutamate desuccinylase/aspartoacylase family protein [Nostoc linckia]PHK33270.1 succinylglutamate desuccinylase [Nostoc linckia z15]PHK41512.1 succinylglutamate desuccinylase [Nostoc linckia z16]PHJ59477.1 succinylglutamate desuccinylase [Nostoc linckia z1]PHJ62678.1 succinylglutamate desuccinylase [Nostoc linckia z3]PHJ68830.1 succinylglutamate desuccinylase [Nostoc linckia z2]
MFPVIETIPLRQMASGDRLFLQLYKFIGAQPGKKVYIQSNLHGAEIAGNAVIQQLIEFLLTINDTHLTGEIWLVPVCNPMGTNERAQHFSPGRYCVYEAKDWNRIFWDYEKEADDLVAFTKSQLHNDLEVVRQNYLTIIKQQFAKNLEKINSFSSVAYTELFRYKLQSISLDADYLIDLHSSNNQGLDYIYYFRNREESAKYFLLDLGILLDKYDGDAFDEAFIKPWLALEACFQDLGREIKFDIEAWTLELGAGMQMNLDSVAKGVRGVKNYLAQKGVLKIPNFSSDTKTQDMNFVSSGNRKKYYAIAGGMIQSRIQLGSTVKAGEKLYKILSFNKESQLPTLIDVCAEQDGLVYDVATNQAVNQGEFVLGVIS